MNFITNFFALIIRISIVNIHLQISAFTPYNLLGIKA